MYTYVSSFIGNNFKTLPYLVDTNLKRKKKQPIFINDGTTNVQESDVNNDMGSEWSFMEICKMGRVNDIDIPENPTPAFCRYLHHGNSYLKLGPFKEEQISSIPYSVVFHDILTDSEMDFLKVLGRSESPTSFENW